MKLSRVLAGKWVCAGTISTHISIYYGMHRQLMCVCKCVSVCVCWLVAWLFVSLVTDEVTSHASILGAMLLSLLLLLFHCCCSSCCAVVLVVVAVAVLCLLIAHIAAQRHTCLVWRAVQISFFKAYKLHCMWCLHCLTDCIPRKVG